jgi:Na+-driven multidrug efflux pump
MTQDDKKKAVAKRLADAAEKMGVAGMALAAYQGNFLAGLMGLVIFLYSIYLTWRLG